VTTVGELGTGSVSDETFVDEIAIDGTGSGVVTTLGKLETGSADRTAADETGADGTGSGPAVTTFGKFERGLADGNVVDETGVDGAATDVEPFEFALNAIIEKTLPLVYFCVLELIKHTTRLSCH